MSYIDDEKAELCKEIIKTARECAEMLGDRDIKFIAEPYLGHSTETKEQKVISKEFKMRCKK